MRRIKKQSKEMRLERKSDNLNINLLFSYLYQDNKEIGVSVSVNNSCELIFDNVEEFNNMRFTADIFEEMLWQAGNREKITEEEAEELSDALWELSKEVNTGINQYYIVDSKKLLFFDLVYLIK